MREAECKRKRDKMTIGRNSRQSSVRGSIRAPKFLDKSSGFYGRLEEPEVAGEREEVGGEELGERLDGTESGHIDGEAEGKAEGMMGDDGETLLERKPSRLSSRWRRSTRRKQKEGSVAEDQPRGETADTLSSEFSPVVIEVVVGEEDRPSAEPKETALVHFAAREDEDDQVLIRDTEGGRDEEGEEERRMKKEQEEGMKMVKRNAVKNYRKVGENRQVRALSYRTQISVMLSLKSRTSVSPRFNLKCFFHSNKECSLDCSVTLKQTQEMTKKFKGGWGQFRVAV